MIPTRLAIVATVALAGAGVACSGAMSGSVKPRVIIEGTSIVIVSDSNEDVPIEIPFAVDSDVLEEESHGPLDAMAMFLDDNPELALIEVQGHSDERGSDAYNLDLSRRRAKAVVGYLVGKGIDSSRLRSKGFGARRPAARGAGESAWRQNRRVEFVIVESGL